MNDNVKETLTKAVEYANTEKEIKKKAEQVFFDGWIVYISCCFG